MAKEYDNVDLILLGYEFCAAFAPSAFVDTSPIPIEPLTCNKSIRGYLRNLHATAGSNKLNRVVAYILDNAASPAEVTLSMLLNLPSKWDGYGIAKPLLNYQIDVDPQRTSTGKHFFKCDMYWPDFGVALEYQSNAYHALDRKRREDERRINDLLDLGITVLQANNDHLQNPVTFQKLALQVARCTKARVRPQRFDLTYGRRQLHTRLRCTEFWNR
jgi:hypothetical protein